ncbi:MAG: hypothetical protein RMK18_02760 [Armatimonadota bacterium]|nr:hypothetical protein [Armatimonadota bacterium]MCX7776943.1 hypothetical protein [Armatimonadota bacterium]MDW8024777.1 hypothetical protein [Armatimonadota bacterium]
MSWVKATQIVGALMSFFSVGLVVVLFWHLHKSVKALPDEERNRLKAARAEIRRISLTSLLLSALVVAIISILSAIKASPFSPGQALAISLPLAWLSFGIPLALLNDVMTFLAALSSNTLSGITAGWLLCVSLAVVPVALSTLFAQLLNLQLAAPSESFSGCAFSVALMSLIFVVTAIVSSTRGAQDEKSRNLFLCSSSAMHTMASIAVATLMMTLAIAMHRPESKGTRTLIVAYPIALSASLLIGWHVASGAILLVGRGWIKVSHLVHPIVAALAFIIVGSLFTHVSIRSYANLFILGAFASIFAVALSSLLYRQRAASERDEFTLQQLGIAIALLTLGMIAIAYAAEHGYGVGLASIGFLPAVLSVGAFTNFFGQEGSKLHERRLWRVALLSVLPILVLAMRLLYERHSRAIVLPPHSPIVFASACIGALSLVPLIILILSSSDETISGTEGGFLSVFSKSLLMLASIGLVAIGFTALLPMLWGVSASFGFIIGVAISTLVFCTSPFLSTPSRIELFAFAGHVLLSLMLCIGVIHATQLLSPISFYPRLLRVKLLIGSLLLMGAIWGLTRIVHLRLLRRVMR